MALGLLTALVLFCLMAGTLPLWGAVILALCVAVLLALLGHDHGRTISMDVYARRSRFAHWNPGLKLGGSCWLLFLCVLSPVALPSLLLAGALAAITVGYGGLSVRKYLTLMGLPAGFLLLSALTLLWSYSTAPLGLLHIPCFGGHLVVTAQAQETARLLLSRAFGAVSCLYFLSLSTPLPELLSVLRRFHLPEVVLDLMVLIYRYIFLLLDGYGQRKNAAASRLGYGGWRRSLGTTGAVYANLLAGSFRRSTQCFDAMESRCYTGGIRFLEEEKPVTAAQIDFFALLLSGATLLWGMGWR